MSRSNSTGPLPAFAVAGTRLKLPPFPMTNLYRKPFTVLPVMKINQPITRITRKLERESYGLRAHEHIVDMASSRFHWPFANVDLAWSFGCLMH